MLSKNSQKFDERKSRVIELRFFGGLSIEETAKTLGISIATVGRETAHGRSMAAQSDVLTIGRISSYDTRSLEAD